MRIGTWLSRVQTLIQLKISNNKQTSGAATLREEKNNRPCAFSFFLFPSFCLPMMSPQSSLPLPFIHRSIKFSFHPPRQDPIQTITTSSTSISNPRTKLLALYNKPTLVQGTFTCTQSLRNPATQQAGVCNNKSWVVLFFLAKLATIKT